jgi:antirestriction protein ArdC
MKDRQNVYDRVTNAIIKACEANPGTPTMPWHRPTGGGRLHMPRNASTDNAYRGINILMLWIAAAERSYDTGIWSTYKQWSSIGAQVRKGETASLVVFYKRLDAEPDRPDDKGARFVARTSMVFNAAQVDGFSAPDTTIPDHGPIAVTARFQDLVSRSGAVIHHHGSRAFYRPSTDEITMPPQGTFVATPTMTRDEGYMSTLAHELAHYSGAKHRLNRELATRFKDKAYYAEEIIAELCASYICAELGISSEPRADHAQYIHHYIQLLKSDARAIFTAAAAAAKAADYLIGDRIQADADDTIAQPPRDNGRQHLRAAA